MTRCYSCRNTDRDERPRFCRVCQGIRRDVRRKDKRSRR